MNRTLANSNFRNVHFIDGNEKFICYRTGTTVYEEVFKHGRFIEITDEEYEKLISAYK